ncbi:MAG: chorismate mutase [Firmicutes bacterium]|jgi:chorismate mutase|nr:chorismate mutase [Bacillota bacterium]
MPVRGVRGATTCAKNSREAILAATRELLQEIQRANDFKIEDVAAAIFSVTDDLNAAFPAAAARELGWQDVALFDCCEIPVPGSLPRCIRVLLLLNCKTRNKSFRSVYLNGAEVLRPDLTASKQGVDR